MGKVLVIKGANFSNVAVENIDFVAYNNVTNYNTQAAYIDKADGNIVAPNANNTVYTFENNNYKHIKVKVYLGVVYNQPAVIAFYNSATMDSSSLISLVAGVAESAGYYYFASDVPVGCTHIGVTNRTEGGTTGSNFYIKAAQ